MNKTALLLGLLLTGTCYATEHTDTCKTLFQELTTAAELAKEATSGTEQQARFSLRALDIADLMLDNKCTQEDLHEGE